MAGWQDNAVDGGEAHSVQISDSFKRENPSRLDLEWLMNQRLDKYYKITVRRFYMT